MNQWSPSPAGDSDEDTADKDEFLSRRDAKQPPNTGPIGRTNHFQCGVDDGSCNGQ